MKHRSHYFIMGIMLCIVFIVSGCTSPRVQMESRPLETKAKENRPEGFRLDFVNDWDGELPEAYDLREERSLSTVRNQGSDGTCWAFAAIAALETAVPEEAFEALSVDHITMNNGFHRLPTQGGDYNMTIAYLSAWQGPVSDTEDLYGDETTDLTLKPVKHLQEARILKEKNIAELQAMILQYGGVESPIYMSISNAWEISEDYQPSTAAYYYSGTEKANHDVVIIGWDNDYRRENFKNMPENDGAFICRNSWGEDFGENGYFYVSYEDAVLGNTGVIYTRLENPDNYSTIYQTDMLGWVGTLGYEQPDAWFSNIYTTSAEEVLKAVSFYAVDANTEYELYVVSDYIEEAQLGSPVYLGNGYCEESGYYTVDLPEHLWQSLGERFAVIVHVTTPESERPIAIEYQASELTKDAVISDGEGYVSPDGEHWTSAEEAYHCNVCLKAFTD